MSKLILCSGERTNRPYGFPSSGVRIYSMEELCYYLYNHIYMIEEDMFSEDLFQWIDSELKMTERANKLKQLKLHKADVKTIVTVILCSSDYYSENEIKGILRVIDDVIDLPYMKRNCMKANNFLKSKRYAEAAAEYEKLIISKEALELTPEEYGDLYHNLAVTKVHLYGYQEASKLFGQAYERNRREESLRQYLYTLKLSNNEKSYLAKMKEYQIPEEMQNEIEEHLMKLEEQANHSELMKEMENLKHKKSLGKMSEYYEQSEQMIEAWKGKIRLF